ncbi:MAG: restriction endonuclease subunit S [Alphaproteobacteria bacterium]|nr:restriction endonuclease subunit S [Alphaproteobacteria bacterium]
MTRWREVKLGDLGEVVTGKTPSTKVDAYWDGSTPFVTPKDIQGSKHIFETERYLSNEGLLSVKGSILPKGAICVSCIGNIGYVSMTTKQSISNQQINSIITNDENEANFVYYLMKSLWPYFKNYEGQSTTLSILNKSQFSKIDVCIPKSKDIQKKIAGVLSALDDKIELNNKINNNLEQQAQALFNEKIVNKSKQGCIGDYCSIKSGFAFKSSWWQNTGVRVIKIKNIEPSGLNLQECSFVSEDKVSIAKEFIVKGGDLLIAMTGATIGKFAIVPHVDEILLVNQRVGKFFLGNNPLEKLPFIYCTLKQPEVVSEIINRGQGSAQPNISGNDIMSITCTYPDENIIADFNNICRSYFEKIITNQYENTRLAALRDTLLPKLMKGEIDVSNVDISALTSADKLSFNGE